MKSIGAVSVLLGLACSSVAAASGWEPCGWGGGGWFWFAAADPKDADVFYMGGDVDGLWKTTDAGETWRFMNDGLPDYAVYSLAVAPSDPQTVYALTGGGVAVSTNGASAWRVCADTRKSALDVVADRGGSIHAIAVDPTDPKTVYVGGKSGRVVKSTDDGLTWSAFGATASSYPARDIVCSMDNPGVVHALYVDSFNCLIRSTRDGGESWQERCRGADITCFHDIRFLDGRVYGAAMDEGTCMSQDGGANWSALFPLHWQEGLSGHHWRVLPQKLADGKTRVMWRAMPNLTTGVECWITAGGAHHTTLTYDVTAEQMQDFARIMGIEFVHITKETTVESLEHELFLNDLAWKLR